MCDILHGSEKIKTEEDASSCSFSESSQNEEEKKECEGTCYSWYSSAVSIDQIDFPFRRLSKQDVE